ncbi:ATP-binding cassette domain-containing protein [Allokutzneria sp. A3M-2-11 16]|uniref:ABC transporter ATP-binding protein n=1 Tax=Allokutzneria sp. A3M-2-11 16 TaxID=2962043 RepID=UPI0020B8BE47|nr:ATP-binding cassette domain-containing protein [Allokutzneria sp. A3M-2-11 16]MCP3803737.1 ATP-binding cassette domain-containing protein [Allokutzneria sp. A3M-2-11 16]
MAEQYAGNVLELRGVRVDYPTPSGPVTAVDDVHLTVPRRGLTVLAGPSGSGKSTLLRMLGLVEQPTAGTVFYGGEAVTGLPHRRLRRLRRDRVVMIFQNPAENLFDYLTVGENLLAAAQLAGRSSAPPDLLARLGLPGTEDWRTSALSGGQQQRLAFACALATGAEVLLADEPTSQLDARSATLVLETLAELATWDVTVVTASHDDRLIELGEPVVRLRDGRIHR